MNDAMKTLFEPKNIENLPTALINGYELYYDNSFDAEENTLEEIKERWPGLSYIGTGARYTIHGEKQNTNKLYHFYRKP